MVPCFSWCITIFPSTKSPSFHSLSQKGYLQPLQPWTPGGSRDWIIISSKRAKENCQWPTFSSRCSRDQEFWGHVINIWWLVFFGRNPEKDRKMRYYDVWLPIGQLVGFIALIIYSLICQLNYFRHCSNGDNLHDLAPKITRMGWTSWSSIAAVKKKRHWGDRNVSADICRICLNVPALFNFFNFMWCHILKKMYFGWLNPSHSKSCWVYFTHLTLSGCLGLNPSNGESLSCTLSVGTQRY